MAWIRPSFMDNMSWEMAEVYGAITDQILINLAKYFPFWKSGESVPRSAFEYQANMLAQMGQVNRDTIRIIANGLGGANKALTHILEQAIMESVKKSQPELLKGVREGLLHPAGIPIVDPQQTRAFRLYYQQAAQKLNLVNTVMLESTGQAYQATVADIAARIQATQTALDIGAGETVTGVSSWNQALRHSIQRMKDNGITGFIDHANHHWSAEAYTAMDIRTTVANTARAAVWETNQDFGNDLYIVSYHDGARPLCYPWQNKVISASDRGGTTTDLDGNEIEIIPQNRTSYGEPAGLFGINCKHYPSPFIPGVSALYDQSNIMSEKENEKVYEQTQQQRALEREIREQKRDLLMAKNMGASKDELNALRAKIRETDDQIDAFCSETGLPRRQSREGVFTTRSFPDKDTYDVTTFERQQKDVIDQYFTNGGAQQGYTFGQMTPNAPAQPPSVNVQTSPVPQTAERNPIGIDPQTIGQYPYKPSELPSTPGSLNVYGEQIKYSEKMDSEKWRSSKETVETLASEFKSRLREVRIGQGVFKKGFNEGSVDKITGTMMHLASPDANVVIHEFAHTISTPDATKRKFADDSEFWKEIRNVRTKYRKAVYGNPAEKISTYADSEGDLGEFMAEAFALGYMRKYGIPVPDDYGQDITYSSMVLQIIEKYFSK